MCSCDQIVIFLLRAATAHRSSVARPPRTIMASSLVLDKNSDLNLPVEGSRPVVDLPQTTAIMLPVLPAATATQSIDEEEAKQEFSLTIDSGIDSTSIIVFSSLATGLVLILIIVVAVRR